MMAPTNATNFTSIIFFTEASGEILDEKYIYLRKVSGHLLRPKVEMGKFSLG